MHVCLNVGADVSGLNLFPVKVGTEIGAEIRLNSSDHKMGILLYFLCLP